MLRLCVPCGRLDYYLNGLEDVDVSIIRTLSPFVEEAFELDRGLMTVERVRHIGSVLGLAVGEPVVGFEDAGLEPLMITDVLVWDFWG